jgi:hypothetical protein
VILSKTRARKIGAKGAKTTGNAFGLTLTVHRELAYDLDVRHIVAEIRLALMEHFKASLKAGRSPDNATALQTVRRQDRTGRKSEHVGYRSGYMADHWWCGKILGSFAKASVTIKPYGGDAGPRPDSVNRRGDEHRSFIIKLLLAKGIDFQSVQGRAHDVIALALQRALKNAVGEFVHTPPVADTKGGTLPEIK